MFSSHLFTHKYDIDDILLALCGTGTSWLNTSTGEITPVKPQGEESHIFAIEPLPASFIQEIATSPEQAHLAETDKTTLQDLLQTATVNQLPSLFEEGRTGGWIRERVKDTALEWLDSNDLIPPSMRHINRNKATRLYNTRNSGHTVIIEEDL